MDFVAGGKHFIVLITKKKKKMNLPEVKLKIYR